MEKALLNPVVLLLVLACSGFGPFSNRHEISHRILGASRGPNTCNQGGGGGAGPTTRTRGTT